MEGIICNECEKLIQGEYLNLELRKAIPKNTLPPLTARIDKKIGLDFCSKKCVISYIKSQREMKKYETKK